MRNINELIGIVKGINFDGVINDKEIMHLQSWVDKNRNLVYEPRQVELIKLVDSVLKDHIINDKEKDLILSSSEHFLKVIGIGIANIYELNGIIEGIVCDGEVNEAEVYRLKEWMDAYGNDIRSNKANANLYKLIDEILEDAFITEEEQNTLLEMLSDRINNSRFETKLDYLCKQVKARKNIGMDLMGILDNKTAIQEIHKRAEIQLMSALTSYSSYVANQEIIVVSLVLIAMLEYDGNYYENVRSKYLYVYEKFSEQKVEGLIRSILGRYKKQTDSGSRSRIINVALENAIVPQAFLSAFFDFVFDIYKLNFEFDLPEELYEDFKFVFEGLRNNMLSEGDDISINVTQKTYKLIASTKRLITREEELDAIIKLSILIVKLIDKRFWGKETRIFNPYLKAGFDGWEKQLIDVSRSGREYRRCTSELRSKWEPKYVMANNAVCLIPPTHKVKAQYDYRDIVVVLLNDDEEIYRNIKCDIREIIGGYQVNSDKILLEKPLGKLGYRLIAGDEVIYDSKEKLHRNYIVFNGEGQEINNNTDYEGTAYFCYEEGEADLQNILTRDHYCIGYKLVKVGDAVGIGHDVFNFSSIVKPGIFGQLHKNCIVQIEKDDKCLSVYKEVNVLVFEADSSATKFEIAINGKSYKISDMKYKVTYREAISKYIVEIKLDKSGIYRLEVNQLMSGKINRILRETFVYDAELTFNTEELDNELYKVTVTSGLFDDTIYTEIDIGNFKADFIKFETDRVTYSYLLPFDFGFYRIDSSEWYLSTEELWIDDIQIDSVLKIYDSECDGLLVYTESGILAEDDIVVQDRGFYKQVPIGFLNSYRNGNKYVLLVFTANGKKKYIIACYNKCIMKENETEILFLDNPKRILVTPSYHGKSKVFFELYNNAGELIYKSKELSNDQTETFDKFNSFEEYIFNFHEMTKLLMLKKNTLLFQIKKMFYAKQDFVGRAFKIDEVYFNQYIRGEFLERSYNFNKLYVCINEMLDDDIFLGEVFVKTYKGEWYLKEINPVEIEICSDIVDDTMDIYITNAQYGDGLLMDFENRGIMNSLDHPTAPDIFLYTISTKGEVLS